MQQQQDPAWNIQSLFDALTAHNLVSSGAITLSLVEGPERTIQLNAQALGDLPVFIAITGEQIIVDALLVEADDIVDVGAFNTAVLRSRDLFALSSIGLETLPSGEEVYSIFGALSAFSPLSNITIEVETLVENIKHATDVFSVYFKQGAI